MDNFTDVLVTFLDGNIAVALLSMGGSMGNFIKNILICVPKMNLGLTGLERHEGQ